MQCKLCGAIVPENGIFCPNCGKRADGKKECPSCKKLIDESAIYCAYCGTRTDGKTICEKCGTAFEGKFCHVCGTNIEIQASSKKNKNMLSENKTQESNESSDVKNEPTTTFCKVERILSPTFMLVSIFVLFICSFFIGTIFTTNTELVQVALGNFPTVNVFYFFSNVFNDIGAILEAESSIANSSYVVVDGGLSLYLPAIICLISVASNLITSLTMLIIASVKYGKGLYQGKKVNIFKYLKWSLLLFIIAVSTTYSYSCINVKALVYTGTYQIESINLKLSIGAILGLLLSGLLVIASIILKTIKKGKKFFSFNNITTYICSLIGSILLIFVIKSLNSSLIGITYQQNSATEYATMTISSSFLLIVMRTLVSNGGIAINTMSTFYVLAIASYLCYIVMLILLTMTLIRIIKNLCLEQTKWTKQIVFSSVCVGFSIAYTICSFVLPTLFTIDKNSYTIFGDGLFSAIMLVVILGVCIVAQVITKKANKDKSNI